MKFAGKFAVLLMVLYLFGSVAGGEGPNGRVDETQLQGKKIPAWPNAESLAMQVGLHKGDRGLARSSSLLPRSQEDSAGVHEPPFLRHPILFSADSVGLSAESKGTLKSAAAWLSEHREVRILIVGYCDASGSESCTHGLAERRGTVVRQVLTDFGVESDQISGVKGWDTSGRPCGVGMASCQQLNRSARLFITSALAALK
jgi:outer membrane protein OmpA-like peptidoglycan-associated protein